MKSETEQNTYWVWLYENTKFVLAHAIEVYGWNEGYSSTHSHPQRRMDVSSQTDYFFLGRLGGPRASLAVLEERQPPTVLPTD